MFKYIDKNATDRLTKHTWTKPTSELCMDVYYREKMRARVGILTQKTVKNYIERGFQGDPTSFNEPNTQFMLGAVQGYRGGRVLPAREKLPGMVIAPPKRKSDNKVVMKYDYLNLLGYNLPAETEQLEDD